jgi:hypothetical protein
MESKRKSYYTENREMILRRNKEYYHKKKNDNDFYKKVLDRNKKCYSKKQLPPLTQEDKDNDEKQMQDVINWVKTVREMDEHKPKEKVELSRTQILKYFQQFIE